MLLGQAADFISQAIAQYRAFPFYQHIHDFVAGDLAAGVVDSGGNYATGAGVCAGQGGSVSPGTIAASVGASIAPRIFSAIAPAAAAGPIGAAVVIGASVIGLFAALFRPNQYTRDETKALCAAVPAANAVLQQVDQEVQYGTITPQQAVQALQTLLQQFSGAVEKLINHYAGNYAVTGNNAEFLLASLKAIVAQRIAQYQAMPATAATVPGGSIVSSITSAAAGVPRWLLYLVGGFLVFELV